MDLDADRQTVDEPGRQSERREPEERCWGCELEHVSDEVDAALEVIVAGNCGSGHTGVTTTGVVANIERQTRISRRRSG